LWEHIIVVDCENRNDLIDRIAHPQRTVLRCERPHNNYGHTCPHNAHSAAQGDCLYYLDDDNYLSGDRVLEDLAQVTGPWAIFPILRHGRRFFSNPPGRCLTDAGNMMVKRELGPWPNLPDYDADGIFAVQLLSQHPCQALPKMRPLMVMPASNLGK